MYINNKMQHRRQKGKGFMSFMKKVGGFLKKTKLLSRVGSALGAIGVPYAGTIGSAAGMLGYGRRRRVPHRRSRGGAMGLAGGALRLAGQARRMHPRRLHQVRPLHSLPMMY